MTTPLSDTQISRIFLALQRQPFEAIEPYAPLHDALAEFKGSLVFLRHGETAYSQAAVQLATGGIDGLDKTEPRVFQGYMSAYAPSANGTIALLRKTRDAGTDIPLSESGQANTAAFAQSDIGQAFINFATRPETATYKSPQTRVEQTAQILGIGGEQLTTHTGLAEIILGDEFGKPSEGPEGVRVHVVTPHYQFNGGDNTDDYTRRVVDTFVEILQDATSRKADGIAILGHSQSIATILAAFAATGCEVTAEEGWKGKINSYEPVEVSAPDRNGARTVGAFKANPAPNL